MMARRAIILGARSAIARELASLLAQDGRTELLLAGRDLEELERDAADLRARTGAKAQAAAFDALAYDTHGEFWQECVEWAGTAEEIGVIVCCGTLPDQAEAQKDAALSRQTIDSNFTGVASILTEVANTLEERKQGFICVISSVAGDRGRQKNYIYGSAKAGLSSFTQGLRQRLAKANVAVLTVKPGFVDTAMTFGLEGMFLVASAGRVARDTHRAIGRRADVLYTPWFWRIIMGILGLIPERVYKKMSV
jgi:decaprenylphospho-beta-D-erythro-pentofuranosid-2-ulose 2-reductase